MTKEKSLSDFHKAARRLGEITDYIFSGQDAKDIESGKSSEEGFIKLVREYAIQKKGYSVFEESDTKFEKVSIE